jgi:hypothetical protein
MNPLDVRQQRIVVYAASARPFLRGTLPPLMEATGANIQHLA